MAVGVTVVGHARNRLTDSPEMLGNPFGPQNHGTESGRRCLPDVGTRLDFKIMARRADVDVCPDVGTLSDFNRALKQRKRSKWSNSQGFKQGGGAHADFQVGDLMAAANHSGHQQPIRDVSPTSESRTLSNTGRDGTLGRDVGYY